MNLRNEIDQQAMKEGKRDWITFVIILAAFTLLLFGIGVFIGYKFL